MDGTPGFDHGWKVINSSVRKDGIPSSARVKVCQGMEREREREKTGEREKKKTERMWNYGR